MDEISLEVDGGHKETPALYDDPTFFAGYSKQDRSVRGLEGCPEWPVLRSMVGSPDGLRVLDLGCGRGWHCRWAQESGAAQVLGLGVSTKMLERARAETHSPLIKYDLADMENLTLPNSAFDLVFSSLALHYVSAFQSLMSQVRRALKPGGRFVFSVEHPLGTGPHTPQWQRYSDGRQYWCLEGYKDEGPRTVRWLDTEVVKQHRPIETYVMTLIQEGFLIQELREWEASDEQMERFKDFNGGRRGRAHFLMIAASTVDWRHLPSQTS